MDSPEQGKFVGQQEMVFDDEVEEDRFLDHVYEKFDGAGLHFPIEPVRNAVRVDSWLLTKTRRKFAMRPLTAEDVRRAWQEPLTPDEDLFGDDKPIRLAGL